MTTVSAPDIRLVAVDMDGTLLDEHGKVPPTLWDTLDRLAARGIAFAPASGRQYATLKQQFGEHGEQMVFIAENGSLVMRAGDEVSSFVFAPQIVREIITAVREMSHDVGMVLCGKRAAYIERTDDAFRSEVDKYYAALHEVDDLTAVDDEVLKLAIFDFGHGATTTAPALQRFADDVQIVVSSEHWVDVMVQGVNKGLALQRLQASLGVTPAQTMVFGDYLNDLELMDAAEHSYAMENAHPEVAMRARFRAPSNREHGVIQVLERLLQS